LKENLVFFIYFFLFNNCTVYKNIPLHYKRKYIVQFPILQVKENLV